MTPSRTTTAATVLDHTEYFRETIEINESGETAWAHHGVAIAPDGAVHTAERVLTEFSAHASGATVATVGLATTTLTLASPADAFLAFPGFGEGFVWVNGTRT